MKFSCYLCCVSLSLLLNCVSVFAEARITYTIESKDRAKNGIHEFNIKGGKLELNENVWAGSRLRPVSRLIFDSSKNQITTIDHRSKTFILTTESTIQATKKKMTTIMPDMEKSMTPRLSKMSQEEQIATRNVMLDIARRAAMSTTPSSFSSSAPTMPIRIRKTTKIETVNGIRCEVIETFRNQKKETESCIADFSHTGLASHDFETMLAYLNFEESIGAVISATDKGIYYDVVKDGKLPIKIVTYKNGIIDNSKTAKLDLKTALPQTLFSINENYTEKTSFR